MKLGTVVFADPRAGHGRKRCGSGTPWAHGRVREGKPKDTEREWEQGIGGPESGF